MPGSGRARLFTEVARRLRRLLAPPLHEVEPAWARGLAQATQLQLAWTYRRLVADKAPLPSFDDVEFRAFSQNGEDGILLLLFSVLGTTDKRAIELGAADGIECNSANLVINHGWQALLVDGDPVRIEAGRAFYRQHRSTWIWPPRLVHAWLSAETVNDLVIGQGFDGDLDLLSLDLDGMDYWVWKATTSIRPRLIVVEYQTAWGPDERKVVVYDPAFRVKQTATGACYAAGASLAALAALGRQKGYRLVGVQRYGFNAFFLRHDVGVDLYPEVSPATCFWHPHAQRILREDRKALANYDWVTV